MVDITRSIYGRFSDRAPDPIVAGTSLDTAPTVPGNPALTQRPHGQPKQILVRPRCDRGRHLLYSALYHPCQKIVVGQQAMEAPGSSFSASQKSALVEPYMIFQSLDHPELVITWASEFPDKLKIRKEVTLWPLRFKLRGDYTRALRAFEFGCSCKDALFGGRIRVDAGSNQLEYRKRLKMGHGMIGATVRGSYAGIWDPGAQIQPQVSFEYELWGGAAIWSGNAINWRHKIRSQRVSKSLALEVAGNVELPAPAARYHWQRDDAQRLSVGQGAFRLHLDQCNVVVDL